MSNQTSAVSPTEATTEVTTTPKQTGDGDAKDANKVSGPSPGDNHDHSATVVDGRGQTASADVNAVSDPANRTCEAPALTPTGKRCTVRTLPNGMKLRVVTSDEEPDDDSPADDQNETSVQPPNTSAVKNGKGKAAGKKHAPQKAKPPVQQQLPKIAPKPQPVPRQTPEQRLALWNKVEEVLRANYDKPEINTARAIFATVASHRIPRRVPCWAMIIAPSGSMKTEVLKSLEGLPSIHFVDTVTENTFLSGKIDGETKKRLEPASYLHRMGPEGVMVCADFSTYLSLDPKKFASVLGQLRRIYDGHIRKETGSDENAQEREWKGRLTLLAGCTSEIDRQYKVFQALGDRFVRVRASRFGGAEVGAAAIDQENERGASELKTAVHAFMFPILSWAEIEPPAIPAELKARIANLSELVCYCRAYVPRSSSEYEIDGLPEPESNTRIAQELAQLARGWAVLMGADAVDEAGFNIVKRAAWDTIPPNRRLVLNALIEGDQPQECGLPRTTANRTADDLVAIGLADKEETGDVTESGKPEYEYNLSYMASGLIAAIKGDLDEVPEAAVADPPKKEKPRQNPMEKMFKIVTPVPVEPVREVYGESKPEAAPN